MTNNTLLIEFVNESTKDMYSEKYLNKNKDSGFDLYIPQDITIPPNSHSNKIFLGVKTALYPTENTDPKNETLGYMLLPRSSTGSKTQLRLSNSVGIIDSGYQGELIACVDNLSDKPFVCEKGSRLFQIVPFCGNGVGRVTFGKLNNFSLRSVGGFGSTGK